MTTEHRAALIVGAGPRLGAAIARRLGRDGYTAALVGRTERTLARVADELRAAGVDTVWAAADATNPAELRAAIGDLAERAGGIEAAVHNMSTWRDASTLELTPEDLFADLRVGTTSLLTMAQAAAPAMIAAGSGTIIATGSAAADSPTPGASSLGVQKAALRVLVRAMAAELAPSGVHCATVTVNGVIGEGVFAPERIAEAYAGLVAETAGPRDAWRTVVGYDG